MMKTSLFFLPGLLAVLSLSSCTTPEDEDTVKPVIGDIVLSQQTENISVTAGELLHINVDVRDNENLGEFKMDIHDVFDGHAHGKKSSTKWVDMLRVELSGREQHVHEYLEIPAEARAGPYHAVFNLVDAAGNEADFVEVEFTIVNGHEPEININDPDFTGEVHAPKGSTLEIAGTITDSIDLDEIIISLREEHGGSGEIYEEDFDLPGSSDTSWDFQADGNVHIPIPSGAETGHHLLRIVAIDSDGNMSIFEGKVHIM